MDAIFIAVIAAAVGIATHEVPFASTHVLNPPGTKLDRSVEEGDRLSGFACEGPPSDAASSSTIESVARCGATISRAPAFKTTGPVTNSVDGSVNQSLTVSRFGSRATIALA
jgi:hypothetical protein